MRRLLLGELEDCTAVVSRPKLPEHLTMPKLQVGAVSYLNTKPLLWGIERSPIRAEMDLQLMYPAKLAAGLKDGSLDLALMPVAAMPGIPNARIVGEYGIAA